METTEIKAPSIETPLSDFQKSALEQAEKELENLKKELANKIYTLDISRQDIANLHNYLMKDAPWKFTECLGIVEVEKYTKPALKSGKLELNAVALEAIYYYLSKIEGFGKSPETEHSFTTVEDFLRVLKPINSGMEEMKKDADVVRRAEFVAAARREGIDPETTDVENDGPIEGPQM